MRVLADCDLKELPIIVRIYRTKQAAISMSTRQNFHNSDLTRNFSREQSSSLNLKYTGNGSGSGVFPEKNWREKHIP